MKEDFEELYKIFLKIRKMGYVESKRKGNTGIGYTFEELINKPEENFSIPDFNSIEIKTCRKVSRRVIHLFSATPDGDFLFPINRLIEIAGYPDKIMKDVKVFNSVFNGKYKSKIGYFKCGIIKVNYEMKKVDFEVYDCKGNNLNVNVSWSFSLLEEKLNIKLKNLAIIYADSKIVDDKEYFHYIKIKFYKLKSFETFLSLIERGYIKVAFNVGVYREGNNKGRIHDRGVGFKIDDYNLSKLYDEVKIK